MGKKNGEKTTTVVAKDREHLKELIKEAIREKGPNCDLNFIDVSNVEDMSGLFADSEFNGDISKWNVSNVMFMAGMFEGSGFDGDISEWDLGNIKPGSGPDYPPFDRDGNRIDGKKPKAKRKR